MKLISSVRRAPEAVVEAPVQPDGCMPIGEVVWRHRARVTGTVKAMRVRPWGDAASLEATVYDETGGLVLVFLGRRDVPGIVLGARIAAEGMVGNHHGTLSILNPVYELQR